MKRRLVIESLDPRLCFALGDVVSNFAQTGEYSVSYPASDVSRGQIVETFALPDGQLTVATSEVGSGWAYTLVKLNMQGQPDTNFGTNGQQHFIDPQTPNSSIRQAIALSDGRLLLRAEVSGLHPTFGVEYSNLIAFHANGSLDTSFADGGYLRLDSRHVNPFSVVADRHGGFYVLGYPKPEALTALTHYTSAGQLDASFGQAGTVRVGRLSNPRAFVDSSDRITVWGNEMFVANLQAYRILADGSLDSSYGVAGVVNVGDLGAVMATTLADDGESLFRLTYVSDQFVVTKYRADYQPDNSFGTNGSLTVPYDASDPKLAVKLFSLSGGGALLAFTHQVRSTTSITVLTAFKISANGTLDSSFGAQGISEQTIAQYAYSPATINLDGAGGLYWVNNYGDYAKTFVANHTLASGAADNQFGFGQSEFQIKPPSTGISYLHLDPLSNGRVRLQSGWNKGGPGPSQFGRSETLNANGDVLNTSAFGSGVGATMAVSAPSADGGWYIAQNDAPTIYSGNRQLLVYKYRSDGSPDSRFGTAGRLAIQTSELGRVFIRSASDGSVVIVADSYLSTPDPDKGLTAILRLRPDGSPDSNFGPGGVQRLASRPRYVVDVQFDRQGGILLVHNDDLTPVTIRRVTASGAIDSTFGTGGSLQVSSAGVWKATAIDEDGRILVVAQQEASLYDYAYKLSQWTASGTAITSFGTGGSVSLPITPSLALPNVEMAVSHGVIVIAAAHNPLDTKLRLMAVDYAGQLLLELGGGGVRDYELSADGETVADLIFANDDSLWLGTYERDGINLVGNVLKLKGASTPTLRNWSNMLDVNADAQVTPLDALIVISVLNGMSNSAGMLPDVNGDARVTALDALLLINHLNSKPTGEGEPVSPAATITMDMLRDVAEHAKRKRG